MSQRVTEILVAPRNWTGYCVDPVRRNRKCVAHSSLLQPSESQAALLEELQYVLKRKPLLEELPIFN